MAYLLPLLLVPFLFAPLQVDRALPDEPVVNRMSRAMAKPKRSKGL